MSRAPHRAGATPLRRLPAALLCLLAALAAGRAWAVDDARQLAPLPAAAQANLRDEMLANLRALNDILSLLGAGKLPEAGEVAERELGRSAMGKNRSLPFEARPGAHMPPAMHRLGLDGHDAASRFAAIAASGDRDRTLAALPLLTAACIACHHSYRIR
jgi:hypothetical protein